MRIAFMGTPAFAVPALAALHAAGHEIACVYSQPPRPAGRGHKLQASPVQTWAEAHGIEVRTPATLKDPDVRAAFAALDLDVAVVAAYGLILPRVVLDAPRHGCLNIHASLLPRWRGAAPIQRAILAGDDQTGVTIMQMEAGLDTGPMLLKSTLPITGTSTAPELTDRLAIQGAELIVDALTRLSELTAEPQPEAGVTYAHKLTREESAIDWSHSAKQLDRQLRALVPWPGVSFDAAGERIKLLKAEPLPETSGKAPGTVLDDAPTIACGSGSLRLLELQRPGKAGQKASEFLRGFALVPGQKL
jgi:methionyl-tRNA formyltransferase